jgi:hypothetical protein
MFHFVKPLVKGGAVFKPQIAQIRDRFPFPHSTGDPFWADFFTAPVGLANEVEMLHFF